MPNSKGMLSRSERQKDAEEANYWDRLNKQAEDYGGDDSWRNDSKLAKNANNKNKQKVIDAQNKMRKYILSKQGEAQRKKEQMFKN